MTRTTLPRDFRENIYLDGMELGAGIDAITGEITRSAVDPDFKVDNIPTTNSRDTFSFRAMNDVTELENSDAFGFSSSLTFPADGVKVGAKRTFDFTSTSKSSSSIMLIVFNWERHGQAKGVRNAKLSAKASQTLNHDGRHFRDHYGDYFVSQISYTMKFTAVWKCTADKSSDITNFNHEISGSIAMSEMEASGTFTTKLSKAAARHRVTIEVQYQAIGDAGTTQYDKGDILRTFNSFRDAAKPIPSTAVLQHYKVANSNVPATIDMQPAVFERVRNVFTTARFVLFLIGIVPGKRSVRLARRNTITRLFSTIHANRIAFQLNPNALKDAIGELDNMRQMLWTRLERQDLVTEMRSLTYDDFKSKFAVDHENVRGAWVQSSTNQSTYVLGRIGFSPEERARYGILSAKVAEVNVGFVLLQQQVGALEFPAASGIDGYIVGLSVESCWTDGTNGWWCIGNQLQLGAKQAKIEVKTEGSRGMHWRLTAYYIPSSEYEE